VTTVELESALAAGNAADHLSPERWAVANRHLVRKALAEFSHERILVPEPLGNSTYRVRSDDGTAEYRFAARILQLDHWSVDAGSITCSRDGQDAPVDALRFITEFSGTLGIRQEMLPVYLEEISSTLSSHAFKQWMGQPSSAELAAGVTGGADAATDFQPAARTPGLFLYP
jgi:siderophore synthetase component